MLRYLLVVVVGACVVVELVLFVCGCLRGSAVVAHVADATDVVVATTMVWLCALRRDSARTNHQLRQHGTDLGSCSVRGIPG